MKDWPTTEEARLAAVSLRLHDLLTERGEAFRQRRSDYQRTRLPSFEGGEVRSREAASDTKAERQLARACEDAGPRMRLTLDMIADMIELVLLVTNTDKGGAICIRCGRRIDPKTETVKWWKSRDAVHPSCYVALWRAQQKAS